MNKIILTGIIIFVALLLIEINFNPLATLIDSADKASEDVFDEGNVTLPDISTDISTQIDTLLDLGTFDTTPSSNPYDTTQRDWIDNFNKEARNTIESIKKEAGAYDCTSHLLIQVSSLESTLDLFNTNLGKERFDASKRNVDAFYQIAESIKDDLDSTQCQTPQQQHEKVPERYDKSKFTPARTLYCSINGMLNWMSFDLIPYYSGCTEWGYHVGALPEEIPQ